jgi:Zn-dependent membrane protease YugP
MLVKGEIIPSQYIKYDGGIIFSKEEYAGAKKVLTAAALTYVAALAQSILQLLYFITRFSGNRRR